ncbi:MAG: hypothetical protein AAEJ52_01890 [Myxococcota bacterium]
MQKTVRIVVAIPGVMMLLSGLQWLFRPQAAAEGLGMPLLEGVARSTQIGDLGSFFLATSTMILLGAIKANAQWLHGAALLLGGAALMRLASLMHGAEFATQFILAEVVMTAILLICAAKLDPAAEGAN